MDDKASVGKISVSSDSVSTLNSEDFVLVSHLGDETPSTNNGSDDEKTGLKVRVDRLTDRVTQNLKFCYHLLTFRSFTYDSFFFFVRKINNSKE